MTKELENEIVEFIKKNPGLDSVDIVIAFGRDSEKILTILVYLSEEGRVERNWNGIRYGYEVKVIK